jgi:alpha-1,3-glucan synthase
LAVSVFIIGLPVPVASLKVTKFISILLYAFASSAGSLFFSLNFGEEAGVDMSTWIFRAGAIDGIRQLWTAALYYWAQTFDPAGYTDVQYVQPTPLIVIICFALAGILFIVFAILALGLPSCYRTQPAKIPLFYLSIWWRKIALWFLFAQFVQNYWLSGAIGRNFQFLWSQPIPQYAIAILVLAFALVWVFLMLGLYKYGKAYSWILPVFSVGLLSPLWAQMSWSTSNIGQSFYWAGAAGPYLSLSLWLWLGVLVSVQSVGFSMMLLQVFQLI